MNKKKKTVVFVASGSGFAIKETREGNFFSKDGNFDQVGPETSSVRRFPSHDAAEGFAFLQPEWVIDTEVIVSAVDIQEGAVLRNPHGLYLSKRDKFEKTSPTADGVKVFGDKDEALLHAKEKNWDISAES